MTRAVQLPACDQKSNKASLALTKCHCNTLGPLTNSSDIVMQGKYINDPEVLKEAARVAGVDEYERAIQDSSIVLDQVAA